MTMRWLSILLAAWLCPLTPVSAEAAKITQAGDHGDAPLIPRRVLFGNPDRAQARISPDGRYLSYLAPHNGVMNVWVAPVDRLDEADPVTDVQTNGVRNHLWAHTNRHILYLQDNKGDENWRVLAADIRTGDSTDLTPFDDVQARLIGLTRDDPDRVLITLNKRDPRLHDLFAADLGDASLELVAACPPGGVGWILDESGAPRYVERLTRAGGSEWLGRQDDGSWAPVISIPPEDLLTTSAIGFDAEGRTLFMLDSRDRDTAALVALDTETGERDVLASDARTDIGALMITPVTRQPQAVMTDRLRPRWRALNSDIVGDLLALERLGEGAFRVVSRTLDDRTWVVSAPDDDGPARYYLYDREAGVARHLFPHARDLVDAQLSPMHPVVIETRDGLEMVSYLTLPRGSASSVTIGGGLAGGDAVTLDAPLPLILLVHGGPWYRDRWGFSPAHQLLANRGYAVLSVNFRGSTGFGKRFVNLGDREWGGAMQDDLIDAVRWAIDQGVADPDRVAIMGASYGGYAALMGLARDPEVFSAGVALVAPSNLVTLLESIPPYLEGLNDLWRARVGDVTTPAGRAFLESRSPVMLADAIKAPLLLAHGERDPRVPKSECDAMAKALAARGLPVAMLSFADEGHGLTRAENRLAFYALTEAFLAEALGGRAEPIGSSVDQSSVKIELGPDLVSDRPAPRSKMGSAPR